MTLLDPIIHFLVTTRKARITLQDVIAGAERSRRQVLRVMDKLTREGYLVEVADNPEQPKLGEVGPPRRNPTWKVARDLDSRPKPNPPRKNTCRDKMWRLIRAKRRFTKAALATASGCKEDTVDQYVRQLERGGYIRRTGRDGRQVTYMLVAVNQIQRPRGMDQGQDKGGDQ